MPVVLYKTPLCKMAASTATQTYMVRPEQFDDGAEPEESKESGDEDSGGEKDFVDISELDGLFSRNDLLEFPSSTFPFSIHFTIRYIWYGPFCNPSFGIHSYGHPQSAPLAETSLITQTASLSFPMMSSCSTVTKQIAPVLPYLSFLGPDYNERHRTGL